jgi:hypothetical protein
MAAGAFTGTVATNFNFQEKLTVGTIAASGITIPQAIAQTINYSASGTAAGQVNLVYGNQVTFVASTPQTFDMQTWTDPFSNALVFARVRLFVIQVVSQTAGWNIELYASSSNGVTFLPPVANYLPVNAGSLSVIVNDAVSTGAGVGTLVTSSTLNFTINPGTNPVVVNILAAGGTAV